MAQGIHLSLEKAWARLVAPCQGILAWFLGGNVQWFQDFRCAYRSWSQNNVSCRCEVRFYFFKTILADKLMAWCNGHESVVATESIANVESTD